MQTIMDLRDYRTAMRMVQAEDTDEDQITAAIPEDLLTEIMANIEANV